MEIAVLLKQVPDSRAAVDPVTHCLLRESAGTAVNPADLNALAAALALKEKHGGRVTAFTMGPDSAKRALQTALAMGAEEARLLTDRCFGGGDTLCTARVLARAIQYSGGYDLILAGDASSDSATGQVGAMVAELLALPCACDARRLESDGRSLTALRSRRGQEVLVRMALPCMATVCLGSNTPAAPTSRARGEAERREIIELTNRELGLDPATVGKAGARSVVIDSYIREAPRRSAVMLGRDAAEAAKQIAELLREEVGR